VFLFVGQLLERKGVRVLLRAIDEVHDAQLWIAGDGPLRAEVEAKAASSSRVVYHGHLGQEELHHLYTYATALVLPSLYEVWGLVVNEALDHGIPAVVTDQVGAADDLIEDGLTGYCVRAGSVTELADAMKQVAAWSQKQRHACSRRGAELLSAYTFEAVASGIFEACKLGIEHRARSCSHSRTRR
jgi:glycosyltransferase involved in cell wall biosynthesis